MTRDDAASVEPVDPSAGSGWAGAVPNLQARTVVGVFDDTESLERAYREVVDAGCSAEECSIVRQDDQRAPHVGAGDTKSAEGTAAGATAGAVLGGIAGLAALAIPGVGPFIAAGPIALALGGAVTGGALGGLVGSFVGLGIPDTEAKEYEAAVRSGGTFLSVKVPDSETADRVSAALERYGAQRVASFQSTL